jgi:hypothetical protein
MTKPRTLGWRAEALIVGLWVSVALPAAPAVAQPARAPISRSCCHVPAGTVVEVELVDQVSTKVQRSGDTFALRLAAPLIVNGRVVLRAGAPGVGEVVESAKPGMGGKPAELVLAARYLRQGRVRVELRALQLAGAGRDNSMAAQAVGLTGIAFAPLGFVGLAVRGGNVVFPPGTSATAKVAADMMLPSLGPAPRHPARGAASRTDASESAVAGSIEIPPPPAGAGQVIFFRKKSLLGTGQWFNVREDGKALGKLANGAYFVRIAEPGAHTYTATEEPEFKDRLKLEIDPGETYFVEGTLTKGVVIGAADMSPSDRATFDKASKDLKLAQPPAETKTGDQPDDKPADTTGASSSEAPDQPPK